MYKPVKTSYWHLNKISVFVKKKAEKGENNSWIVFKQIIKMQFIEIKMQKSKRTVIEMVWVN